MKLISVLILLAVGFPTGWTDSAESRLLTDLIMRGYQKLERPVDDYFVPSEIQMSLALQQILDVDETNQVLTISAWLMYAWHDYKMQWLPTDYDGIKEVRIPPDLVWHPDILVYNTATSYADSTYATHCVVSHTGDITWIPPGVLQTTCDINVRWFPFDDQNCELKFGSWSYNNASLHMLPMYNTIDMTGYIASDEWEILSVPVYRATTGYHDGWYDTITFVLHMRRMPLFYIHNILVPMFICVILSTGVFVISPNAGKITFDITILCSVCLSLSVIVEVTPHTSVNISLLSFLYTGCMLIVWLNMCFTITVFNVRSVKPNESELPPWLDCLFLNHLPRVIGMKPYGTRKRRGKKKPPPRPIIAEVEPDQEESVVVLPAVTITKTTEEMRMRHADSDPSLLSGDRLYPSCRLAVEPPADEPGPSSSSSSGRRDQAVTDALVAIMANIGSLDILVQKLLHGEKTSHASDELVNKRNYASTVCDRLSMIIFILFLVLFPVACVLLA